MPRKINKQLLIALKDLINSNLATSEIIRKLNISRATFFRYKRILKSQNKSLNINPESQNDFDTHNRKVSKPIFPLEHKNQDKIVKSTKIDDKEARRKLFSAKVDKSKVPVETRSSSIGVEGLFGGLGLCRVHGLILDCGVVGGAFGRCRGFGYMLRVHGNLSNMFRVFKFGERRFFEVRVYRNDRVVVYVSCSGASLDDVDLINFWGFLSGELYRISGHKFIDANRIVVEKVELNNDGGVVEFVFKNSPVKVVTFRSFSGAFVRLYESKSRLEVGGPTKEASRLAGLIQTLNGGVSVYYLQQVLAQFVQNMKYIEALRRELEVLRSQVDSINGSIKRVAITPKLDSLVKSSNFAAEIESLGRKSGFSTQLSDQVYEGKEGECPFWANGCREPRSKYSAYINPEARMKYCFGDYRSCFKFKLFVKRYGLKGIG